MRILQFGFWTRRAYLSAARICAEYGCLYGDARQRHHAGWWKNGATAQECAHAQLYLQPIERDEEIVGAMMRAAARSVAKLCIFPMQTSCVGQRGAHEYPANRLGNWGWRYEAGR